MTRAPPSPPLLALGSLVLATCSSYVGTDGSALPQGDASLAPPPASLRPLAPESGGYVATRRPRLRWLTSVAGDRAEVELCADRLCTRVIERLRGEATASPTSDLPVGPVFWRVRGLRGDTPTGTVSATWTFFVRASHASAGTGWGGPLDVNGDGLGDLAVGEPAGNSNAGRVNVFLGDPAGPSFQRRLDGVITVGRFGHAIANAGDLNGDGFSDLAVASLERSGIRLENAGEVRVFLGGPAGLAETPVRVLSGSTGGQVLGGSIASAGDVDRDGYADLLVTARARSGFEVRIYRGDPGGIAGTPARALAGGPSMVDGSIHVAGIGDVDGDGTGDFAAGFEPSSAQDVGEVRVFLGPLSAMGAPTILRVSAGLGVGRRLSGAGDVNGDGYADLLVSAPFATDTLGHAGAGAAFLYLGGPSGILTSPARRYEGGKNDMGFGLAAAGLGDTNGDGYDDVAVGGTVRAGLATVFGGGEAETTHTLALPVITGPLGWAVAGTGDLNGDGLADVAWCDAAFRAVVIYTGIHQPRPPVPETIRLNPPMAAVGPVLAGLR